MTVFGAGGEDVLGVVVGVGFGEAEEGGGGLTVVFENRKKGGFVLVVLLMGFTRFVLLYFIL